MIAVAGGILIACAVMFSIACMFDRDARGFGFFLLIILVLVASAAGAEENATIYVIPRPVSEEAKVLALKLGYALNDNSMVRWGTIDLTDLPPELKRKVEPPPPPLVNDIMPEKKRRNGR